MSTVVFGSTLWAATMALSAALSSHFLFGYAMQSQIFDIALIYFAGAWPAFAIALFISHFILQRPSVWRIALIAIMLAGVTITLTAGVMALVFRAYYAQWHAPFLSQPWLWQQLFTTAGAVYQYLVIGLRFYMPLGMIGLIVASLWANRLAH